MIVSVIIIAKNDEERIERALESVKFSDDVIVVVDDRTTDKTEELAKSYTSKTYVRKWEGFGPQRTFAVSKTKHDWVLWIDSDEAVTKELRESIEKLPESPSFSAFRIGILSEFMNKWMYYSWSPVRDRHIRLFNKQKCKFDKSNVHEKLVVDGEIGYIEGLLEHRTFKGMNKHVDKVNLYSTLAAQDLFHRGVIFQWWQLIYHPTYAFLVSYFKRQGFRDGLRGFVLCSMYAFNTFLDYVKLWELKESRKK
jgi:glycosyltransferase involved in cell wall biosynthesis